MNNIINFKKKVRIWKMNNSEENKQIIMGFEKLYNDDGTKNIRKHEQKIILRESTLIIIGKYKEVL